MNQTQNKQKQNHIISLGPADPLSVVATLIQKSIHARSFLNFHIAPLSLLKSATGE